MEQIPEHLAKHSWYAPHQAWALQQYGVARHDSDGAGAVRADLHGAYLRGANLSGANCRGGFAVLAAGEEGRELERRVGVATAAALIYHVSTGRIPDFYASNEDALADIRACAAAEGVA